MEHKLILGGEQYLPFARSRIKAMREAGVQYGTQRYEVAGATVRVQTLGEHDYIEIREGVCQLQLDSGVVDVLNTAPLSDERYAPGVRIKAGSVAAYEAAFTEPSKGGFLNPSSSSAGQLAGLLKAATEGGKFRGWIPPGVPSFEPRRSSSEQEAEDDDLLWAKKLMAQQCPASVFTGRCRLYVQAMYGLPLYEYSPNDNVRITNAPMEVTPGVPALRVPAYRKQGEENSAGVPLNTSCGVYLDPETGNHWLFRPTEAGVDVFPLISNECGEKLRKHLRSSGTLNAEDKEHLEAYVLAYSRPHVGRTQKGSDNLDTAGTYSMGFGWHWNWSGTEARLIKNETVLQSGVNYKMRSTHWQMVVTKAPIPEPPDGFGDDDPRFTWTIPVFALEGGPKDWWVDRSIWVITEPRHSPAVQVKTTPKDSLPFEYGATPFYAFYIRDVLQLCTVQVTLASAGTDIDSSPGYGAVNDYITEGEYPGFARALAYAAHYTLSIAFGAVQHSNIHRLKESSGLYSIVDNKIKLGSPNFAEGSIGWGGGLLPDNDTYPSGNHGPATFSYIASFAKAGATFDWTWQVEVGTRYETNVGRVIAIVPAFDAEAIFAKVSKTIDFSYDGTRYFQAGPSSWTYGYRFYKDTDPFYLDAPIADRIWYAAASSGPHGFGSPFFVSEEPAVNSGVGVEATGVLACRNGTPEATFTSESSFFNQNLDEVDDPYIANTNAGIGDDVVISQFHIIPPINVPGEEPISPALVGWV